MDFYGHVSLRSYDTTSKSWLSKVHVSREKWISAPHAPNHSAPALSCSEPLQVALLIISPPL